VYLFSNVAATGMILRLPVHAGHPRHVREAILEAIKAEW
jgi:hypothetical protein